MNRRPLSWGEGEAAEGWPVLLTPPHPHPRQVLGGRGFPALLSPHSSPAWQGFLRQLLPRSHAAAVCLGHASEAPSVVASRPGFLPLGCVGSF